MSELKPCELAVLVFSSSSACFQIELFINGNKVISYLLEHEESGIHSPLFKGAPVQTAQHVWYTWCIVIPSCYPPCCPPLNLSSWSTSLWLVLFPSVAFVTHFGFQTALQYSEFWADKGLFFYCARINSQVTLWFAFEEVELMCEFHLRSWLICTPRYLIWGTEVTVWPLGNNYAR